MQDLVIGKKIKIGLIGDDLYQLLYTRIFALTSKVQHRQAVVLCSLLYFLLCYKKVIKIIRREKNPRML